MKTIMITVAASLLLATQSYAGSYQKKCSVQSVPYQATVKGGEPEKVIGGALIGGVIGKAVTDKNAGAAAGALIGGAIGHENSKKTVTRYKDVETCKTVFVPDRITNRVTLENTLLDLNAGRSVSKEMTMDAQYTIGVAHDGKWGPASRRAAREYLASYEPQPTTRPLLYSLVVNDVLIHSSTDAVEIDDMKQALFEAGVASEILVDTTVN
ncbi:glycine zipper domain-containing protein [Cognatishimia maritima]|uniref:Glycine zipper 2TM domain n=1 Tax=Cognatishimia maritima TaxID=870908 RepID=A0A1M5J834_9RHOB|nr:glycine zipper 2TM domain-containing protein [Cognatishimia maritima]SHG36651.1 Glycine zipper 2TM domain [Cognatishimia maritima]